MHPAHEEGNVLRPLPCLHVVMNVCHMKVVSWEDVAFMMFLEAASSRLLDPISLLLSH